MACSAGTDAPKAAAATPRSRPVVTFVRAPSVEEVGPDVEALAEIDGNIVAVRFENQWALAFHPELDESDAVHGAFLHSAS